MIDGMALITPKSQKYRIGMVVRFAEDWGYGSLKKGDVAVVCGSATQLISSYPDLDASEPESVGGYSVYVPGKGHFAWVEEEALEPVQGVLS